MIIKTRKRTMRTRTTRKPTLRTTTTTETTTTKMMKMTMNTTITETMTTERADPNPTTMDQRFALFTLSRLFHFILTLLSGQFKVLNFCQSFSPLYWVSGTHWPLELD